jgi:hypothetical protein
MPITVTINAETPEELHRWASLLSSTARTEFARLSDAEIEPETAPDEAPDAPLRGKVAEREERRIVDALFAAETLGALADVKADNLAVIDRLPQHRQRAVQSAHDQRAAALAAKAPAERAPEPPVEAAPSEPAPSAADMFSRPAPAPEPAPAANENEITDDQVRLALEACMKETSFVDAQGRMQALGYNRLSDVPKDRAAREAFIAKMNERSVAA